MRFLAVYKVVFVLLLPAFEGMLADARTRGLKGLLQSRNHQDKSLPCFSAFNQCSRNEECSTALRRLDMKCKVISGRCGAEMVDLTRCGQVMDHIFSFGFPEARCECLPKSEDCQTMLDKIYSNPCFVSIRHLRKYNLFPKEIHAYDQAKEHESTTTAAADSTSAKTYVKSEEREDSEQVFEEIVGARKQTARTVQTVSVVPSTGGSRAPRPTGSKPKRAGNKPRKEVINPPPEVKQIAKVRIDTTDNTKRLKSAPEGRVEVVLPTRKSLKQHSWESPEKERTGKDDADYKSIAIILGVLLGLFLLSSVALLSWARIKGSAYYTGGKFVPNQREDEGIHSKSQLNFSTSTFVCSSGNPSLTNGMA